MPLSTPSLWSCSKFIHVLATMVLKELTHCGCAALLPVDSRWQGRTLHSYHQCCYWLSMLTFSKRETFLLAREFMLLAWFVLPHGFLEIHSSPFHTLWQTVNMEITIQEALMILLLPNFSSYIIGFPQPKPKFPLHSFPSDVGLPIVFPHKEHMPSYGSHTSHVPLN